MNYLAHLFLSPEDDHSRLGNIMADFLRGVDRNTLPQTVQAGILLHQQVDGFTDNHLEVRRLRQLFSPQRRRFSGIVLDVTFDHFLIKHWQQYSTVDFDEFVDGSYVALGRQQDLMPERMKMVMEWMVRHDWFRSYVRLEGIGRALDGLAGRLKLTHGFHGSIEEVEHHYSAIEEGFLIFFPELRDFVKQLDQQTRSS